MKFKNTIEFQGNGTHKSVKQKIRTETEARVVSGIGGVVSRSIVKRRYPINIITSTVPRKGKDAYLAVTNVSHALMERFTSGEFWGSIYNRQDSNGWMEVKDHSVLAGEANTRQRFGYRDRSFCYSRNVAADNGWLTRDNSSYSSCVSSS
ncbi:hypothetical protein L1049_012341 [Liquidambar formosana]|uniref:Uncharacterized protein n=1 Tax=Liquidambar formosana TaxID=63359 RepID=A0AAP0X0F9_LIQFO